MDDNNIDKAIKDSVNAKIEANKAYAKKLKPTLETPVGASLKQIGFTRLALAFYEENVRTIDQAAGLMRSQVVW